ncbi:MAG: CAP domain-containing protein [Dehalococcoidia bacterium]
MDKQNVKGWVVLGGLLLAMPLFSWLFPSSPSSFEGNSDRIGWSDAMDADVVARDVYVRVNDERRARGLPTLEWHEGLADIARRWSEEMIATTYEHSSPEFRAHPEFLGTGENIFMGPESSDELHVGWMRSDGHRENILNPDYSAMGVGVVCRNDGTMWATQIFGVPHGATPGQGQIATQAEPIERPDPGVGCPRSGLNDMIFGRG